APIEHPQMDRRAVLEAPWPHAAPPEPAHPAAPAVEEAAASFVAAEEPVTTHIPAAIIQDAEPVETEPVMEPVSVFGRRAAAAPRDGVESEQSGVTVEWLGRTFYRLISGNGKALLVNPRIQESDVLGIGLDLIHADIILL